MVEADVVCVPCGEGTYSPLGIYCLTCLAGSYTADQINCNPCDAGKYSATDGATSCTACPPGRHQPASGQTECEICEPGRVASASGQATCDQCDAGTYSAAAGASNCVDCAPGGVQPESGRSECEQCAAGRFASSATACSGCRQFGEGRWSPPGAAACDICDHDYYYDGQSCLDCPWSATCARNSTLRSPWIVHEGFYRFSMDTPRVYRCKRNDGCVGGPGAGDAMCADHHRGPLCQLCDKGYYMEPILRKCQRCDRRPSTFLMVAFCVIVIVFFVLVVVIAWSMWRSLWDTQFAKRLKEQCVGVVPATAGVASSAVGPTAGNGAGSSAAGASAAGAGGSAPDADMSDPAGGVAAGNAGGSSASVGGPAPAAGADGDSGSGSGSGNGDCKERLKNGWVEVKKNSKAFAGWLRVQFGVDFLTSSCQQAIWHSWMVLVRFSSVEDVTYPGPMKWMMRAAGLVTFDLAAWLPTPCVEWSYYHTLLFATIFPLVYLAVAGLYKNFKQIHDGIDKAARSCARYLREQFCSRTNAQRNEPTTS